MASLVCWASGRLDVMMNKEVPVPGPVVLLTGTAGRMRTVMTAHGVYTDDYGYWHVPGTVPVPKDADAAAKVQHDNMTLVIAFNAKLRQAPLKQRIIKRAPPGRRTE